MAGRQTAWVGNSFNGDTFRQVVSPEAAVNTTTTVPGTSQSIAFDASNPTSAVMGSAGAVTLKVNLSSSCTTIPTTSVTLSSSLSATINSPQPSSSSGVATFSATFNALGITTLTASAPSFGTATAQLTVFDGELECASSAFDALNLPASTDADGEFHVHTGGATAPGDIGFLAGIRGFGDPDKDPCTVDINYKATNNINGGGSVTDPVGNVVQTGFYSFSWDVNQVEKPVVAIIATLKSEWGDATTGLPTRKTVICTVAPCTSDPFTDAAKTVVNTPDWKVAVACLDTLVTHDSIPPGEVGCLAKESWEAVPALIGTVANSEYCPAATKPTKPSTWPSDIVWTARCLKPTSIMIMGKDPVFGRGN